MQACQSIKCPASRHIRKVKGDSLDVEVGQHVANAAAHITPSDLGIYAKFAPIGASGLIPDILQRLADMHPIRWMNVVE